MSTQQLPVAVGRDRQHASYVFGQSFDRLLLTTYDERADGASGFVAVAADPAMGPALAWALDLLAADPALELGVELPRDPALSAEVGGWLAGAAVRVVGVRRFGDHPCLVLAGADAAVDPQVVTAVLTAAVQQSPPLADTLERTVAEWELAAHKERTDTLERQIRDVRVQLARKKGESRDLHLLADRHGLLPQQLARARQHLDAVREIRAEDQPPPPPPALLDRLSGALGAAGRRGAR